MNSSWQLRDYVFAAFMTIGMLVSIFIIGPLVPPFFQLVAWAPVGGIFLTLGMARLQRRGSVALMILPLAVLTVALSPAISLYLAVTTAIIELAVLFRGNYRAQSNRLIGTVLFFSLSALIGLFSAAYMVGGAFVVFIEHPEYVLGLSLAAAATGAVGWWLGERIILQLRRAGKLDG